MSLKKIFTRADNNITNSVICEFLISNCATELRNVDLHLLTYLIITIKISRIKETRILIIYLEIDLV